MTLILNENPPPAIYGRKGERDDGTVGLFRYHYRRINYPIPYSGGLLITSGFIDDRYVHMGFQAPWAYETVIELTFKQGKLTSESDRFETIANSRSKVKEDISRSRRESSADMTTKDDISQFIDQAFDRTYNLDMFEGW